MNRSYEELREDGQHAAWMLSIVMLTTAALLVLTGVLLLLWLRS